jgi:ComF family protein
LNQCLICHNKSTQFPSLCSGCITLLSHADFNCDKCGIKLQTNQTICGACLSAPPQFNHTSYVCDYQPPIDKWVMALKFGKKILFSKLIAELMLPIINNEKSHFVLVPVPLHKSRLRKRGYNQAYEIAKELAILSGKQLLTPLLRHKNTEMQAQLKFKQRAKNVKNAFTMKEALSHRHIILIDDVMTSGNTLNECAKVLKKAGAQDVKVLVFARKSML